MSVILLSTSREQHLCRVQTTIADFQKRMEKAPPIHHMIVKREVRNQNLSNSVSKIKVKIRVSLYKYCFLFVPIVVKYNIKLYIRKSRKNFNFRPSQELHNFFFFFFFFEGTPFGRVFSSFLCHKLYRKNCVYN